MVVIDGLPRSSAATAAPHTQRDGCAHRGRSHALGGAQRVVCGLVILLAYAFKLELNAKNIVLLLLAVLLVGMAQEGFQLVATKHRPPGFPELFDLGVDTIGGLIGIGLLYLKRSSRKRIGVGY